MRVPNKLPAYVRGSETSKEAAESIREKAPSMKQRVSAVLESRANGLTDEELEQILEWRHQTVSARRRELVLEGAVKDSGRKRPTTSGRNATIWVFIPEEQRRNEYGYPSYGERIPRKTKRKPCAACGGTGSISEEVSVGQSSLFQLPEPTFF